MRAKENARDVNNKRHEKKESRMNEETKEQGEEGNGQKKIVMENNLGIIFLHTCILYVFWSGCFSLYRLFDSLLYSTILFLRDTDTHIYIYIYAFFALHFSFTFPFFELAVWSTVKKKRT